MIIFAEVMFNESISGELPEHIEFVHKAAKVFETWGYPRTHFQDFSQFMAEQGLVNNHSR